MVDGSNGPSRLDLPKDLPPGYPLVELKRLAREVGVMPKVIFLPV